MSLNTPAGKLHAADRVGGRGFRFAGGLYGKPIAIQEADLGNPAEDPLGLALLSPRNRRLPPADSVAGIGGGHGSGPVRQVEPHDCGFHAYDLAHIAPDQKPRLEGS